MDELKNIQVIAFDADDTLWDCQTHFEEVERRYCTLLNTYCPESYTADELFKTEVKNMPELGFGSKAFALSLVENAVRITQGRITAQEVAEAALLGRSLLHIPATPLPGVVTTLRHIQESHRYQMILFTKGDQQEQEGKLHRSGLAPFFDDIVIVSDKTPEAYRNLCKRFSIDISQLLMVGNSFKSDIEPILRLGGYAIHIPFHVQWKHEYTEEFEHDNLWQINHFSELSELLLT